MSNEAKHAVVRTDLMYGTDVRSGLVSVRYMGSGGETPTNIDNGNVLKLKGLMEGEREIFVGVDVAVNDPLKDIVLVATPEVMYDERKRNLDEFENEAGRTARGYHLHDGDIVSLTQPAFADETAPAVNDIVELAAGTKLKAVRSATSGSTTVGKIIAVDVVGRYTYYVIQVGEAAAAAGE